MTVHGEGQSDFKDTAPIDNESAMLQQTTKELHSDGTKEPEPEYSTTVDIPETIDQNTKLITAGKDAPKPNSSGSETRKSSTSPKEDSDAAKDIGNTVVSATGITVGSQDDTNTRGDNLVAIKGASVHGVDSGTPGTSNNEIGREVESTPSPKSLSTPVSPNIIKALDHELPKNSVPLPKSPTKVGQSIPPHLRTPPATQLVGLQSSNVGVFPSHYIS